MGISIRPSDAVSVDDPVELAELISIDQWLRQRDVDGTGADDGGDEPVAISEAPVVTAVGAVTRVITTPKTDVLMSWAQPADLASDYIFTPNQFDDYVYGIGTPENVINGLVPEQSLSLVVSHSNMGKSPLMYQGAMCVSGGIPFLGRPVKQGPVIVFDAENPVRQGGALIAQLRKHLGLVNCPELPFHYWNINAPAADYGTKGHTFKEYIRMAQPKLVILDPVYAFYPKIENSSQDATEAWQDLRKLMAEVGCSVIGIAHLRKDSTNPKGRVAPLEKAENSKIWLQQTRGSSALINGVDLRLGIDVPVSKTNAALILRGFLRLDGELAPIYVNRIFDEEGKALGYDLGAGPDPLTNLHEREVYEALPDRFRYRDVVAAYGGNSDNAIKKYIDKCQQAGLIVKLPPTAQDKVPGYRKGTRTSN